MPDPGVKKAQNPGSATLYSTKEFRPGAQENVDFERGVVVNIQPGWGERRNLD